MEKLARLLYSFALCCILLVLIVYVAVLFGGPGVVGVIVLVLLICDFRKYQRARR
jgi:Flp pilus assembly protein TadB